MAEIFSWVFTRGASSKIYKISIRQNRRIFIYFHKPFNTMNSTTNLTFLENSGFTITRLLPENLSKVEEGVIRAYKSVFNASAWREGVKCANGCDFKATFEEAPQACPNCSGEIVDFYSDEEVSEAIRSVMRKSFNQILVLLYKKDVAWFSWWWKDNLPWINQEKLKLSKEEELPQLVRGLNEKNIDESWMFYYLSEVWITPEYRMKWLWWTLTNISNEALQEFRDEINAIIVRTSRSSPMYKIQTELWLSDIFSYNDTDNRVIFAKSNT